MANRLIALWMIRILIVVGIASFGVITFEGESQAGDRGVWKVRIERIKIPGLDLGKDKYEIAGPAFDTYRDKNETQSLVFLIDSKDRSVLVRYYLDGNYKILAGNMQTPTSAIDGNATDVTIYHSHAATVGTAPVIAPNRDILFVDSVGLRIYSHKKQTIQTLRNPNRQLRHPGNLFRDEKDPNQSFSIAITSVVVTTEGEIYVGGAMPNGNAFYIWQISSDDKGNWSASQISGQGDKPVSNEYQAAKEIRFDGIAGSTKMVALTAGGFILVRDDPSSVGQIMCQFTHTLDRDGLENGEVMVRRLFPTSAKDIESLSPLAIASSNEGNVVLGRTIREVNLDDYDSEKSFRRSRGFFHLTSDGKTLNLILSTPETRHDLGVSYGFRDETAHPSKFHTLAIAPGGFRKHKSTKEKKGIDSTTSSTPLFEHGFFWGNGREINYIGPENDYLLVDQTKEALNPDSNLVPDSKSISNKKNGDHPESSTDSSHVGLMSSPGMISDEKKKKSKSKDKEKRVTDRASTLKSKKNKNKQSERRANQEVVLDAGSLVVNESSSSPPNVIIDRPQTRRQQMIDSLQRVISRDLTGPYFKQQLQETVAKNLGILDLPVEVLAMVNSYVYDMSNEELIKFRARLALEVLTLQEAEEKSEFKTYCPST